MSQYITDQVYAALNNAVPSLTGSNSLGYILRLMCADLDAKDTILASQDSFAYDSVNSTGLNFYYKAGIINQIDTILAVAAGYVTLTGSATNYVEVDPNSGTVSKNTSGFTAGAIPLFTVAADSSSFDYGSVTSKRPFLALPRNGAIKTAQINDLAVTTAKIAAANITGAKLETALAKRAATITWTIGAEAANAILVTATVKDAAAASLSSTQKVLEFWLADSATGGDLSSAPSGGVAVVTGSSVEVITASKRLRVMTDTSGVASISITESGSKTLYVRALLGDHIETSGAVTFA